MNQRITGYNTPKNKLLKNKPTFKELSLPVYRYHQNILNISNLIIGIMLNFF